MPGHRLQPCLAGRYPPLDPRQLLVASELWTLLGSLIARIAVDDLIMGRTRLAASSRSWTLAAVQVTEWTYPVPASTPMWAFIPKYH